MDAERADTVFGLASNARRRRLLRVLCENGEVSIDTAARRVAVMEHCRDDTSTDDPDCPTDAQVESAYTALYQTHVPQLVEFGAVAHERDRRTLRLQNSPETRLLLRVVGLAGRPRWEVVYGAVAVVVWLTVGTAAATGAGWPVAAGVAGAALAVAVAVRLFVSVRRVAGRCRTGSLWGR
ncbi:hypothetical protein [Halobaculum sp. MBLA0143]|uniref:DUF7344 domain-containing protein n=1 Tax=Halobaculum sp. MBLA0143 TaxID=3079933 RepID=UPI0035239E50